MNTHLYQNSALAPCLRTLLLALCLCLPGCKADSSAGSSIGQLQRELESTIQDARKTIESLAPEKQQLQATATEEVEKLFKFEYTVAEIPADAETKDINEQLSKLGQERWECFFVEPRGKTLRFYCKRRPLSYLRYVPKIL